MSQYKAYSSLKKVKWLKKDQQFIIHTRELLESKAWKSRSINCIRLINRLEIEHLANGGCENGWLVVGHNQFKECGIRKNHIKKAIDEAVEKGLIKTDISETIHKYGKYANMFTLTYVPILLSKERKTYIKPTDEWKEYK